MKKRTGFTLIELLVVMAIMAILTIITVSQFTTARVKSYDAQRKADLSSVSKALLMYYADYQRFPVASEIDLLNGGSFTDASGYVYMKVMPKEVRQKDYPYCYMYLNGGNSFAVLGHLENTQDSDGFRKDNNEVRNITCGGHSGYNFGFTSPDISMDEI